MTPMRMAWLMRLRGREKGIDIQSGLTFEHFNLSLESCGTTDLKVLKFNNHCNNTFRDTLFQSNEG